MKRKAKSDKKRGRPSKLPGLDLKKVEEAAAAGRTDAAIAAVLNISEASVNNYKRDPAFLEALSRGKEKADASVVSALYNKAVHGDTIAQIFWLKNRKPDEWKDRREYDASIKASLSVEALMKSLNDYEKKKQ